MNNFHARNAHPVISALFIDNEPETFAALQSGISKFFPEIRLVAAISLRGRTDSKPQGLRYGIIFINELNLKKANSSVVQEIGMHNCETIIVANTPSYAIDAIQNGISGYLLKPVKTEDLVIAMKNALERIYLKAELDRSKKLIDNLLQQGIQEDLIGIPTIDGYEFICVNHILRCEGLQRCTRIVTKDKSNIVSSYNLGEFKNILEAYDFFSPHKSYLVNLHFLKKYHKEGSIYMIDGACVPVAKRMKRDFLNRIKHL